MTKPPGAHRVRRSRRMVGGRGRVIGVLGLGLALAAGLVFALRDVRLGEARLNGWLVNAIGLADAHPVGSAVIFPMDGRWVGFVVTAGCSVALPLIPPLVVATALVAVGRVTWWHALLTTVVTAAALVGVNQVRLAIIVASMQAWGYEKGYERSHVLIGSTVSTLGLVLATIVFVVALGRGRRPLVRAHA